MQNEQLIFGIRAVIEAITAGKNIDKVFLQNEATGELMQELLKNLKKNSVNFSYVPIEKLNKLSKFNNHQGAVASISPVS
ncbi:MAG TPA: RNA methyltransferase substrate-binding domain-containing protein, partial [Flavobacterium sp.]|nr:RNA methyltransferase substrate-binding domain-containing protein [Flavobacterium sp.]